MKNFVPCPGRRCGVENHEVGSDAHKVCVAKGQRAYGEKASVTGFITLAARSRDDVDYNDPESYHGVYSDAREVSSNDPTARAYEVSLEYGEGDIVIDGITKAKSLGPGAPSTAEVLSQVAAEVDILRHINPEFVPDGGRAEQLDKDLRALLGDDYDFVMERAYAYDRASYPDALSDSLRTGAADS